MLNAYSKDFQQFLGKMWPFFFYQFHIADVLTSVGMLLSDRLRVRYPIILMPWCVHSARPAQVCVDLVRYSLFGTCIAHWSAIFNQFTSIPSVEYCVFYGFLIAGF